MNQNKQFIQGFLKSANEMGVPEDQAIAALQAQMGGGEGAPPAAPEGAPELPPELAALGGGGAPTGGAPSGGGDLDPAQLEQLIAVLTQMLQAQGGQGEKMASEKAVCDSPEYIGSFLKRAFAHGYGVDEACSIYKQASIFMKEKTNKEQNGNAGNEKVAKHYEGFMKRASEYNLSQEQAHNVYVDTMQYSK